MPKSCVCAVCQFDFSDGTSSIHKLDCYHYFHSPCLMKFVAYTEEEIKIERLEAARNKIAWKERSVHYLKLFLLCLKFNIYLKYRLAVLFAENLSKQMSFKISKQTIKTHQAILKSTKCKFQSKSEIYKKKWASYSKNRKQLVEL